MDYLHAGQTEKDIRLLWKLKIFKYRSLRKSKQLVRKYLNVALEMQADGDNIDQIAKKLKRPYNYIALMLENQQQILEWEEI